ADRHQNVTQKSLAIQTPQRSDLRHSAAPFSIHITADAPSGASGAGTGVPFRVSSVVATGSVAVSASPGKAKAMRLSRGVPSSAGRAFTTTVSSVSIGD